MNRRLTATVAVSLLALGSVFAGAAGACPGHDKSRYTSAEPQSGAADHIASLVSPSSVQSTSGKTADAPQTAESPSAQ